MENCYPDDFTNYPLGYPRQQVPSISFHMVPPAIWFIHSNLVIDISEDVFLFNCSFSLLCRLGGPGILVPSGVLLLYISAGLSVWSLAIYMSKIWKVLLK